MRLYKSCGNCSGSFTSSAKASNATSMVGACKPEVENNQRTRAGEYKQTVLEAEEVRGALGRIGCWWVAATSSLVVK